MYRTIGINRQSQLAVIQIRPYQPQTNRAIQWMAYGSNPFNALVPFYANVDTTPDYLADTTTRVTSENFYWENRIIAALCNSAFAETSNAIERYQEKIGGIGHRMVTATDEQVARLDGVAADSAADESYEADAETAESDDIDVTDDIDDSEVTDDISNDIQPMEPSEIPTAIRNGEAREILAAANQAMADQLKAQTDELLDAVLYTTSMKMSNGFNRSDN
jgi:dipeptidase